MDLKSLQDSELPGGLVKICIPGPRLSFRIAYLLLGLRVCISDRFPGDADAGGLVGW